MYCSGCGNALAQGQPVCPQCGRPAAPAVPPIPNMALQVATYAGRIRALSIVWMVYGGLSLLLGVSGLFFANAYLHGSFGPWHRMPWSHDPFGPEFLGPGFLHFVGVLIVARAGLSLFAGWGLMQRAAWGRVVAIVAAFLSLLKFPFGTALGIWTLVTLMGYRNATLYEQLDV